MSYIKEFYKLVFTIPDNGFLVLTRYSDSGTGEIGTNLEKLFSHFTYTETAVDYLQKTETSLVNIETGYIRKGFSLTVGDDEFYTPEEYMDYHHAIFQHPYPIDFLFKYYLAYFQLYIQERTPDFEQLITTLRMEPSHPHPLQRFNLLQEFNSLRSRLKNIETIIYVLKYLSDNDPFAGNMNVMYDIEVFDRYKHKRIWDDHPGFIPYHVDEEWDNDPVFIP
ncbi:hypothetical protein [Alicyclobacillus ferrooxydans]|uniref:Uncharacterized protein n=1 Tax=Alicyclobacillus ferrooxydans TaxID=471514 RepID=A0A0P9CB83_9BACL|nr:hypothetical protein [Alicyclobacillus ferrooxydans]KPV42695.1 hypothetical protein AN477_16330 [Alicyclobacillus ferrooxydans]